MNDRFVLGIDYGTDSVRSVLLNAFTGEEIASSVFNYPDGKMVCIVMLPAISSGNIHWIILKVLKQR